MFACSFVLVPGEVLKTRLQAGSGTLPGVIASILKQDGILGFFAGYGATLLRDVPYTMLELGVS
jgi:Mitochondrial carrier protein